MDLPVQDLEYTKIYRMIHRKVIREAKTRENTEVRCTMHLLGLMHVCDLKENTSSAFFKYSKNLTLIAID